MLTHPPPAANPPSCSVRVYCLPGAVETFDLKTMMGGLDGEDIYRIAHAISPNVAYCLPRNVDRHQVTPAVVAAAIARHLPRLTAAADLLIGPVRRQHRRQCWRAWTSAAKSSATA